MIGKLKAAIENRDWAQVEQVYAELTGEAIRIVPEKLGDPVAAKPKSKRKPRNKPEATSVAKTKSGGAKRPNLFESMTVAVEKVPGYDQINDNIKPTPRTRAAFKPVSVTCEKCHKSFEVAPLFAKENYKCDRCSKR